jgi:[ribosomal protein S5]-alanine N-acetyltransferase
VQSKPHDLSHRLPTLRAPGVELRWLTLADAPALFEIFSEPEVVRFLGVPRLRSRADADRRILDTHAAFNDRTLFEWGLVSTEWGAAPGAVLGTCTLADISWPNRRAQLGFALGRAHWGRGLMSRAVPLLVGYAFESLGLHRLEADADPRNAASLRLIEKLGFRREGYLRERYIQEGEIQDAVFYGLLRADWPVQRS